MLRQGYAGQGLDGPCAAGAVQLEHLRGRAPRRPEGVRPGVREVRRVGGEAAPAQTRGGGGGAVSGALDVLAGARADVSGSHERREPDRAVAEQPAAFDGVAHARAVAVDHHARRREPAPGVGQAHAGHGDGGVLLWRDGVEHIGVVLPCAADGDAEPDDAGVHRLEGVITAVPAGSRSSIDVGVLTVPSFFAMLPRPYPRLTQVRSSSLPVTTYSGSILFVSLCGWMESRIVGAGPCPPSLSIARSSRLFLLFSL